MDTAGSKSRSSSRRCVRLTKFEDGAIRNGCNPIATITWCSGSHEEAAALIWNERLPSVLKANPWLAGQVVHQQLDGGECYHLEYSSGEMADDYDKIMQPLFRHWTHSESFISPETPYEDLGPKFTQCGMMPTFKFDPTQPLFHVSVVPSCGYNGDDDDDDKFALIITLSHVVGDGDTYYAIYHMLTSGADIRSLDVERIDIHMEQQHQVLGTWECGLLYSIGFLMAAIRGVLTANVMGRLFANPNFRVQTHTFLVDMKRIQVLKEQAVAEGEIPFVSTNDIITSWYLLNSSCQHGMMAINLRGRLENYDHGKAGNYENLLYYRIPEDSQSPGLMRRSLATLKRVVTPHREASLRELARGNFAIISSWASFHRCGESEQSLKLGSSCRQLAHLPIYNVQGAATSISMGIIFRYLPHQLAVMVMGTPQQLKGLKDACSFAVSEASINYHF